MDELERLKITIQNRLNEARNRADGVARVMNTTLSQMLKVVNETLEKRKDQPIKKWYAFCRSAEDNGYFTIALSERECQIIDRFIKAQDDGPDEGYSVTDEELTNLAKEYIKEDKQNEGNN